MPDDLERLSGDLVIHAARLVRRLRPLTEAPGQAMRVVSLLDEHGPLSVSALARIDSCSQPTMSGAVATLVRRDWVSKQSDPADARVSLVSLTPAGTEQLARVRTANAGAVAGLVRQDHRHDVADVRIAVDLLRDLLDPPVDRDGDPRLD